MNKLVLYLLHIKLVSLKLGKSLINTWKGFDKDLENLTKILSKKQFPAKLINKVTKQYLNLKFDKRQIQDF